MSIVPCNFDKQLATFVNITVAILSVLNTEIVPVIEITLITDCMGLGERTKKGNQRDPHFHSDWSVSYTHLTLPTILRV